MEQASTTAQEQGHESRGTCTKGFRAVDVGARYPALEVAGERFVFPDNAHPKQVEACFRHAEMAAYYEERNVGARESKAISGHLYLIESALVRMGLRTCKAGAGRYVYEGRSIKRADAVMEATA